MQTTSNTLVSPVRDIRRQQQQQHLVRALIVASRRAYLWCRDENNNNASTSNTTGSVARETRASIYTPHNISLSPIVVVVVVVFIFTDGTPGSLHLAYRLRRRRRRLLRHSLVTAAIVVVVVHNDYINNNNKTPPLSHVPITTSQTPDPYVRARAKFSHSLSFRNRSRRTDTTRPISFLPLSAITTAAAVKSRMAVAHQTLRYKFLFKQ